VKSIYSSVLETLALEQSPLFEPWVDPVSGVTSFILSAHVAPLQQSFYYTNPSFTSDGRFLWFYCAFPPGGDAYYGRQLAVVDFHEQTVRHFPETQFMDASPFVDKVTGEVYWTTGLDIWKRGPLPDDQTEMVASFPAELAHNRRPLRLATHLTRSADEKSFAIDAQIGDEWIVGDLSIETGEFRLWQKFDRCYNHAQFSPTDSDSILIAQDGWYDSASGRKGDTIDRLWLLRRGEAARPLFPEAPSNRRGHEWWDADGEHVWFIDYRNGTEKVNIYTGEHTNVWPDGHTHSHSDASSRYLVGDTNPAPDVWRIAFFNIESGKEVRIVSDLPKLSFPRANYHVHPHPQFCLNDEYVCYTTNVRGKVEVALVAVEQLVNMTS